MDSYGTSIMEEFFRMRVRQAGELLMGTELSVQEIALLMDFNTIYYFSNWFRKQTGQSPTEFRRQDPD